MSMHRDRGVGPWPASLYHVLCQEIREGNSQTVAVNFADRIGIISFKNESSPLFIEI